MYAVILSYFKNVFLDVNYKYLFSFIVLSFPFQEIQVKNVLSLLSHFLNKFWTNLIVFHPIFVNSS